MTQATRTLVAICVVLMGLGHAAAQQADPDRAAAADPDALPPVPPVAPLAGYPEREVDRPLVLPKRLGQARFGLELGISKGVTIGDRIDLELEGRYGVMSRLDLGARMLLVLRPGGNTFRAGGVAAQWQLRDWIAGRVELLFEHFPGVTQGGVALGAPIKWKPHADVALRALDTVLIVYRDPNASLLTLPGSIQFQAMHKLMLFLAAALELPDFEGSRTVVPLSVGGQWTFGPRLDAGAAFHFLDLAASAGGGAADARMLELHASLRF